MIGSTLVFSTIGSETGVVLGGLAAVITAAAALVAAWKSTGAKREAAAANKAVNNVGAGEPTLRELVVDIAERLGGMDQRLTTVEAVVKRSLDDGR